MLLSNEIKIIATNDGQENNNVRLQFDTTLTLKEILVTLEHSKNMIMDSFEKYIESMPETIGEEKMLEIYHEITMGEVYDGN